MLHLTSFLKDNADVRARFRTEFEKPKLSVKRDMIAPPVTKNYMKVGTAFDYLLRFKLMQLNKATTKSRPWVVENIVVADDVIALPNFLSPRSDEEMVEFFEKSQKIVSDAKKNLSAYLESGEMSDSLISSSLLLATLDPLARTGFGFEQVGIFDPDDIKDLRNLIQLVELETFEAKFTCMLSPILGAGSSLLGEPDLILDNTLIDIKTTKNFRFDEHFFHQLMGYYTLNCIDNEDRFGTDSDIKAIAVYYARHGYLQSMPLDEIIDPVTFPNFLQWFKERAHIRPTKVEFLSAEYQGPLKRN